ncbi:hypothetical protein BASA50_003508 [Batrachochytrium salamandrivorans]|uniref:Uncharacterized protein n=1 Tax=Batrachochytrium salamandrivorans TaxID=1357716 RepID=A0ABQ8FHN1_9FUNG|nr:hypothetical protein BASA62_003832 [Batrachochytrium salamandrivorans]KAH6572146.1 hypothetical protein BASA60_006758 [Batrachochytrium salamandrivorans]KAH6598468.1 hypothetical protein BASA50_003508 [Batrachochytrium salamandrivorans]KAH6599127.1 hypothetical protein BASA61_002658 [Batrachochytrium salamandrivorans]KAH9251643.1 hypothetical protein BASA81_010484 [Batrachochytrium salamandrivorans]
MRVGIGTVLSVLSFSVLAAVIPNYDYHDPLLVRRAVNLENKDVLWKRANDEQTGLDSLNSGSGAKTETSTSTSNGGSNPNRPSENRGLSKLGRFREFLKGLYRTLKKSLNTPKQKYIRWSDKRFIQKAVKKLAEIVQGGPKDAFISEINTLLNTTLESARMASGLYDSNAKKLPFFLIIPKGDNQQALLKEMVGIQNDGKKIVKKHLKDVTSGINGITKSPDYVMRELVEITKSISGMLTAFEVIYRHDYMPLVSKVKGANNEEHIKATDTYMSEMVKYRIDILDAFDSINDKIKDGGLTFKIKIPSRFSIFKSRVKERLGFKSKSSTWRNIKPGVIGSGHIKSGYIKSGVIGSGYIKSGVIGSGITRSGGTRSGGTRSEVIGSGDNKPGESNYWTRNFCLAPLIHADCISYIVLSKRVSSPSSSLDTILSLNLSHTDTQESMCAFVWSCSSTFMCPLITITTSV